MADVNIVGKIQVDSGTSAKSIGDLKKEINDAKKALDSAVIGSNEYKQAQDRLSKSTEELSEATGKQTGAFGNIKEGLSGLAPGLDAAADGAAGLGKQLWLLVANPIGAIVAAIVGVFALLYETLRKFDPVMDAIEQGMAAISAVFNTVLDAVLALVTGTKSLGDVFSSLGGDIKEAAKEAVEFTKIQQDLDDAIQRSTVNQAKYNRQINELILQSKDRTKTESERIALIDKALKLEETAFNERKKIADQEVVIAQNAIISGKNLTEKQKRLLRQKGVDYAISLKDTKRITDEEINALAAALAKQEEILNQSVSLREKSLNRKYALEDAAIEKEKALQEKADAARKKREEQIQREREERRKREEKELEIYFNNIVDGVKREEMETRGVIDSLAAVEAEDAKRKEQLRLDELEAERQKGFTLQTQYEFQQSLDNQFLETKRQNQNAAIALTQAAIELFGRQSIAGKALAAGLAAIDTYAAIAKNLRAFAGIPIPGYAIAQAVATGVFGLLNVKKILSTPLPGAAGGGGQAPTLPSGGGAAAPLTPRPERTSLDAQSIQAVGQASQGGVGRTFVLDSDIKSNQERAAKLQRAARLS